MGEALATTTGVLAGAAAAAAVAAAGTAVVTSEGVSPDGASGSSPLAGEYTAGFFMAERELSLFPAAAAAAVGETANTRTPSPSPRARPSGLTGLLQRDGGGQEGTRRQGAVNKEGGGKRAQDPENTPCKTRRNALA